MKNIGRGEGVQKIHTVANVGNREVQKEKNQDIMITKVVVTVNIGDNHELKKKNEITRQKY